MLEEKEGRKLNIEEMVRWEESIRDAEGMSFFSFFSSAAVIYCLFVLVKKVIQYTHSSFCSFFGDKLYTKLQDMIMCYLSCRVVVVVEVDANAVKKYY